MITAKEELYVATQKARQCRINAEIMARRSARAAAIYCAERATQYDAAAESWLQTLLSLPTSQREP